MKFILLMSILTALFSCSQGSDNKNLQTNSGGGKAVQNTFPQIDFFNDFGQIGLQFGGAWINTTSTGKQIVDIVFAKNPGIYDPCDRGQLYTAAGQIFVLFSNLDLLENTIQTLGIENSNGKPSGSVGIYKTDFAGTGVYLITDVVSGKLNIQKIQKNLITLKIDNFSVTNPIYVLNGLATVKICN